MNVAPATSAGVLMSGTFLPAAGASSASGVEELTVDRPQYSETLICQDDRRSSDFPVGDGKYWVNAAAGHEQRPSSWLDLGKLSI